ncbi:MULTISPECIES: hypothetical protein [unclassified Pseudofrankia]|uniref:hypothetical protein n=1 Tax=unclassified Pseudofrankia TaxID=2994372 RepID=UPI0008DAC12D|nr:MULTISPECIES: hypothetical protein [unclassified Pseudofrankia]MDT3442487.1 hypothetical protein [Pseudofrankia sp. BMG5.37]
MAATAGRHPPNVLFNIVGLALIVAGIGLTVYGIVDMLRVMGGFDPFRGDGPPVRVADGAALAFWGIIVFTVGRYCWRGARRRGVRDRFGRLLIIAGYVLLGAGLDAGVHAAVLLWGGRTEDSMQSAVIHAVLVLALWALPGAVLAAIGFRLAGEKALAEAEVNAGL